MDFLKTLQIAGLTLLEQFHALKGRKPKQVVVLAPLLERLNLPPMPSDLELLKSGQTAEEFVTSVITPENMKGVMGRRGVVSRRVINKITAHYGVSGLVPGAFKLAATDPRFSEKRNSTKMLVAAWA